MTNQPKCRRCGSTKDLSNYDWADATFQCKKCSSVPKQRIATRALAPKLPDNWLEKAKISRERILANHG